MKTQTDDKARYMVRLYNHYRNNLLPFDGGIMDQPNYFIDAMSVIQGAMNG